jgi:phosphoribosylaminoimidazolecarboxamide formyltransferase/IMP cyclohydrolase
VLGGKELSYNNLLDLDSALELVKELPRPGAAIIKHNNPCGASAGVSAADAFDGAYGGDPVSAFGGIVAFNVKVDIAAATRMTSAEKFLEAVIAPGFDVDALERLKSGARWSKNLRILNCGELKPAAERYQLRSVAGGLLIQTADVMETTAPKIVTKRAPDEAELASMRMAMLVAKYVRSNAIVVVRANQVVGVGAGQMSRVDACEIALRKASSRAERAVLASDAFFPFRDSIDLAAKAGIRAIIQPGGSVRDAEVIAACDEHDIAMVMTDVRHFRH